MAENPVQHKSSQHSHLRLIYSRPSNNADTQAGIVEAAAAWNQLELFPAERRSDLIIFVRPDASNIDELLTHIQSIGVRNILDIREVPYLVFKHLSREGFLAFLAKQRVTYTSVYRFVGKSHVPSIESLFAVNETPESHDFIQSMRMSLRQIVDNGPTIVFTDTDPTNDHLSARLTRFLAASEIVFSSYLCVDDESAHANSR